MDCIPGVLVQEMVLFKRFSIYSLVAILFRRAKLFVQLFIAWWPFYSGVQNYLCNFIKGHFEEQMCEIISNLGQSLR